MRLSLSILAALLALVSTAAAPPSLGLGHEADGRILTQSRFLDDANRAALLCRAAHAKQQDGGCRSHVSVPGWFSNRLLSVLPGVGKRAGAFKPSDAEVLLPVYEMVGDHPEHQDRHVGGPNEGALADGNVGVVYLEGDGDFVLTDTASGAEHRVPIEPGKLISWPNAGFRHRVENASPSVRRRMLGPMAFDAASNALVGVGGPVQCTAVAGYECVSPQGLQVTSWTNAGTCSMCCNSVHSAQWSNFDTQNSVCYCFTSVCTAFVPATTYTYSGYNINPNQCPPLNLAPTSPIAIGASGPSTVPSGGPLSLLFTLSLPAANARRLAEKERELKGWTGAGISKKPLNSTNYALLVTVPAGATYRRSFVSPALKPASLKKPQMQSNGSLLWPTIPMPLYQAKNSTRKFKVVFKVNQGATSPLVFGASVWQNNVKLYDSAPISVTVNPK